MNTLSSYFLLLHRALAFACTIIASSATFALIDYPGRIDDTFGNEPGNFTRTRLGGASFLLSSMAVQPDGKILVGGRCSTSAAPTVFHICVGRLSSAGVPDSSYGNGGAFRLSENGFSQSYGGHLAMRPDGSTYVGGTCGDTPSTYRLCIARLDSNGSKDATFGSNGFVELTNFNGDPKAVLIRKNGNVVILGECSLTICGVVLTTVGIPETGFLLNWALSTGVSKFRPTAIAEEANNRIVVVGSCITTASEIRGCAVRNYAADGELGGSDPLRFPFVWNTAEQSEGNALAIQPDGAWLLAGGCQVSGVRRFCVRRLLPTGTLDSSYGNAGAAVLPFTGLDNTALAIALQADGKALLSGNCRTATATVYAYCVVRLQQDGRFDTSFGFNRDGRELIELDSFDAFLNTSVLQRDGQLLVGGGAGITAFRLRGGWFGARNCDFDVDGDNIVGSSNDMLLATRIALGFTGSTVIQGASFAAHASRKTWPAIREFMVTQCGMMLAP
jgi:uncharacterized delta-60 repeat protein